ncbi:helix-turn-helix transcriptional regulator [Nocardia asteroides]
MPAHRGVGEFLKSRRARVRPVDIGVPPGRGPRRVAGLRREELARAAGVSVDYYIRLEQGRADTVSDSVLDAVADVLRLSDDERDHLYQLARPGRKTRGPRASQRVRPGLLQLLHSVGATPAFILGRRMDILAWNPLASSLITDFAALAPNERNLARLVLLDEKVRRLYRNRELAVRNTVGYLRREAGRYPDDLELATLIADLSAGSEVFRQQWARHTVGRKRHGIKQFDHPLVGEFELCYESLQVPGEPDQVVIIYTAEPGSIAEAKLELLAMETSPR